MRPIHAALIPLCVALFAAIAACDVEDLDDLDDTVILDDEARAAAFSCAAIAPESTVCVGDVICSSTAHGVTTYRFAPPGGCNPAETAIPTANAGMACAAAANLTTAPVCPGGCAGPVTVQSQNANCCTVKKTCFDPPPPPPPAPLPAPVVPPAGGDAPDEDQEDPPADDQADG